MMKMNERQRWGLAVVGLGLVLILALLAVWACAPEDDEIVALGVTHFSGLDVTGDETDLLVVDQTSTGDIIELRDDGTVVWRVADGGAVTQTGAGTFSGNTTLGDAITDNIYVYGQMRSYDGTDNWADISDVSALGRGNGWHSAYNITGWGSSSDFQALFANTQVTATMPTTRTIYGIEGKSTFKAVVGTGNATGIGIMGKVVAKTTATIPEGYGIYSRVETDGSNDVITAGANFMADLDNSGTITTSRVIYTEADTWTYGLDLSAGTFTNDIVGQNSETISNSPNGEWDFGSANLDTSGDIEGDDLNAGSTVDVGTWLNFSAQTTLAIGADETITPTGTYQVITSTEAITCDTTTCIADGGETGDVLILRNGNAADAITIDGTGANVECKANVALGASDTLMLIWNGSDWNCLANYDNS